MKPSQIALKIVNDGWSYTEPVKLETDLWCIVLSDDNNKPQIALKGTYKETQQSYCEIETKTFSLSFSNQIQRQ